MNLPAYFLADLPAGSVLSPAMVEEACRSLKQNRENYLVQRSTASLVDTLAGVAAEWLDPQNEFRRSALEEGPAATRSLEPRRSMLAVWSALR